MKAKEKILIVVMGPTAVGKTKVSVELAQKLNAEIFSCDSRQIYKELIIGTAKPSVKEMKNVPHHFIDHISIHDAYSAGKFETECLEKLEKYYNKHDIAILAGGTGLYIDSVIYGLDKFPFIEENVRVHFSQIYHEFGLKHIQDILLQKDPNFHAKAELSNPRRILRALEVIEQSGKTYTSFLNQPKAVRKFRPIFVQLHLERSELYLRINRRVDIMVETGLLEEVEQLLPYKNLQALQTVGYREPIEYFDGIISKEEAITQIKTSTRRYAKRQITWFKKYEALKFDPIDYQNILSQLEKTIDQ